MTAQRARSLAIVAAAGAWVAMVAAHSFRFPTDTLDLIDRNFDQLPFAVEAMRRAGGALGACALVYLAAWQAGRAVLARATDLFSSHVERVHVTLAVGVAALSALLFALAAIGVYRPLVVAVVIVAAAASRPSEVRSILSSAMAMVGSGRPRVTGVDALYASCSVLALGCALVAALAPEIEYDALWYHLWLPAQWLAAGRPVDFVNEFISLYPLGWEVLNGPALVLGGPGGAKLLHFVCLPLTASAAVALARHAAPRASGHLVFALTVTAPTMMWEASTAYVDLALTWLVTVAIVCVLRYRTEGDRRWLLVAGLIFGAALSVKHLGLIVLGLAVLALLAFPTQVERGRLHGLRAGVLMTAIALALASPWYARAWSAARNPFFPEMTGTFGAAPPERWSAETDRDLARFKAHFGAGRGAGPMLRLPWDITTHGAALGGALGPSFLMLAPFAVFARRRTLAALAAGCVMYVGVWASPLGSLQLRFLIPLVPALAVLAAAGFGVLADHVDRLRAGFSRIPAAAIAILMVMMLPPLTEWQERDRRGWDGWVTHVLRALPAAVVAGAEAEESYLARTVPAYRAWRFIDAHTPPDALVLTFAGGDHLYSHRARLWSDAAPSYAAIWNLPAGQEDAALRELRRLGVTHVLLDRRRLEEPRLRHQAIVSDRMRRCCLAELYEDQRMTVFRVDGPRAADGASAVSRH